MKKLKAVILGALLLMLCEPGVHASGGEIIFSPGEQTNIVLVNSTAVTDTTVAGIRAYAVNTGRTLYFNINDSVIYQNSGLNNVEIDISYYDLGCNWFRLKYDGEGGSETVYWDDTELYNTKTVITRTIRLDDAYFGNRSHGGTADLILTIPASEYGNALYITSLAVRVLPSKSAIKIAAASNAYGNIFFDDSHRAFSVSYTNKSSEPITFSALYEIKNANKTATYHSETKSFSLDGASTVKDNYALSGVSDYGMYVLCVTASGANGLYESVFEVPFSFCVGGSGGGINNTIGINGHFNQGRESENGMKILRKAGFGNVREGYYWARFEEPKGVYAETPECTECYTNAQENDMDILILAAYSNTNYCETERHIPATDEQREAFADYVYEMLRARNGNVNVVEIWNEPNLEKFNANNLSPADYVRLLKTVYERIKPDYPGVKIGAPTISNAQYIGTWLRDVLASDIDGNGSYDAYKYFDVVTIHHYRWDRLPEVVGLINPLFTYLAQYGCADKEIYHTEFGVREIISTYNAGTQTGTMLKLGDQKQATLLSQYYLLLRGNRLGDRFYIYNFSNNSVVDNYPGGNMGIVQSENYRVPYAAKPALLAIANINDLLKDTDSEQVVASENVNVLRYFSTDGDKEVYAFFTFAGQSAYPFMPGWEDPEFFDMYGNRLTIPSDGGSYTLNLSESPIYAGKNADTHKKVSFARRGDNIVVSGTFKGAKAGDFVSVKVFDSEETVISVGQLVLDSAKNFTFEFTPFGLESELMVSFGTKSFGEVYKLDLNASELERCVMRAYVSQTGALALSDIVNADSVTIDVAVSDDTISNFSVVCAAFKENRISGIVMINSDEMTVNAGAYSTRITTERLADADRVSVLLLDFAGGTVMPMAKALRFN